MESRGPLSAPIEIQRPRSALHAGDFTEDPVLGGNVRQDSPRVDRLSFGTRSNNPQSVSTTVSQYSPSATAQSLRLPLPLNRQTQGIDSSQTRSVRDRAPSLGSFSSSNYVLKPPTTPLVQQSNNTDLDFSSRDQSTSPDKSRRHTLPPHALRGWQQSPTGPHNHHASYQPEGPHSQGHRPRRSLTSNWSLQPSTSPPTPAFLRSRGTSFSSDASPRQHASMVGSYEESILRGWMSTAPSKPLDFTAKIGVLGRNNCRPKCPAHVTVPFPAVFYSWGAGNGSTSVIDEPSPYVGHIDLQHSLATPKLRDEHTSQHEIPELDLSQRVSRAMSDDVGDDLVITNSSTGSRKKRRTSPAPNSLGGSYRIPQQGQLQIIIKNPNKTAVKLFLVPYDLTGMESGTKTFLRQRCFSADSDMDGALTAKSTPPALSNSQDRRKPTLRYLIHLNICSPVKGRYYLYQHIRVVFANRVPDNKEQLRTETQVPEPKYSVWKSIREPDPVRSMSAGARLTAEKAFRRRSAGFGHEDILREPYQKKTSSGGHPFTFESGMVPPVPPIPFNLPIAKRRPVMASSEDEGGAMDFDTSRPTTASDMQTPASDEPRRQTTFKRSNSLRSTSSQESDSYGKLSKGDSGYGGVFGRPGTPEAGGESLLAMRLRGLATIQSRQRDEEE